ncbi:hypothetical protein OUZ56_011799 [Daphnia magna]|uniref:Uncharacterized protein n=1 Tax=Daphnia magna TaxID=35525 RepID=A0ABQ9Z1C2_9CRUS|nr:hypothetical protein OUZ56_011799 [Daphnia magna]
MYQRNMKTMKSLPAVQHIVFKKISRSIIHSHLHVHVILTSSVVDSGSSRLRQLVQRRLDKELKIENSNNSNIVSE